MTIRVEYHGNVAQIILARPLKHNAVVPKMLDDFGEATLAIQKNTSVRCVILSGEGPNFCVGGDIGFFSGFNVVDARAYLQQAHRVIIGLASLDKPVIAAVRGATAGVGWSFAMSCDLILASTNSRFVQAFKRVGLAPDGGAAYFLAQTIGVPRARELFMSGRNVDAKEAFNLGLINEIILDDKLEERAFELATELSHSSSLALLMWKKLYRGAFRPSLEEFLDLESHVQNLALQSKDHREGVKAFLEKRKPKFQGY